MDSEGGDKKSARKKWVWVVLIALTFLQWMMIIWILIVFFFSESTTEDFVAGWEKLPYGIISFISLGALTVSAVQSTHVGGWLSDATLWAAAFQFLGWFPLLVGLAFYIWSLSKCFGSDDPKAVEQVACDEFQYVLWNVVVMFSVWTVLIFITFFFLLIDLATRTRFTIGGIFKRAKGDIEAVVKKTKAAGKRAREKGKALTDRFTAEDQYGLDNPAPLIGQGARGRGDRDPRRRNQAGGRGGV